MHYYKFNIADWALHTAHLSLEEEAVYFRLINHYYDSEKPIPLETQSVIRRLRLVSHSETVSVILDEFFVKTDKGFLHNRCEELLKEYRKTVTKNRKNASKGGRPRKNAASSETQSVSSGLPVVSQENPKGIPNQELLTTNHKPLTNINNTVDKPAAKSPRFAQPELIDVQNYFLEKTENRQLSGTEGIKFHAYYESNGWKVGKNKMKDWKAAARGWITRLDDKPKTAHQQRAESAARTFDPEVNRQMLEGL